LARRLVNEEDTFLWLTRGDLKGKTVSEIIAAQNEALQTKHYATKILQTETDSKCRLLKKFDETVEHIISACPVLAKEQHIQKHDKNCAPLHFNTRKELGEKLETITCMTMCQNRSKKVMKLKLRYYGTNKCETTELFLTINRIS